jgi:hypothetical protein
MKLFFINIRSHCLGADAGKYIFLAVSAPHLGKHHPEDLVAGGEQQALLPPRHTHRCRAQLALTVNFSFFLNIINACTLKKVSNVWVSNS